MSWIVALAAISLAAGCTADPEVFCGDDAYREGGLTVSFEGREPDVLYDFAITAEGQSLVVSATPGAPTDPVTADLGGDRTLSAHMTDSDGSFLMITVLEPPPDPDAELVSPQLQSQAGPDQVTVVATNAGTEVGRATFTPTYDRHVPWGPSCPFYEYAGATLPLE